MQLFDNWIKPSDEGTKATPDIVIIGFGIDDMVNANNTEQGLHDYLSDLAFLTQVHFLFVHEIQSYLLMAFSIALQCPFDSIFQKLEKILQLKPEIKILWMVQPHINKDLISPNTSR